jgi:hypothetical protein
MRQLLFHFLVRQLRQFRRRQDDRLWIVLQQPHVLGNGLRGFLSVAGDHDHMNAGVLGGFDRSVGGLAQFVAHPEHAHQGQIGGSALLSSIGASVTATASRRMAREDSCAHGRCRAHRDR